ncbi:MAG: Mth938-like domain-containing protein [Rhodobacter sp.]|nr:Mth938-like domain-containing protein [Rhodobacter sp.]MCA3459011.1 Mth938-like domain-containing protein [Rhodobacter sp.]MCA3460056.1 Mth938-like domain-containing protein [Rhodobacter sp.]MCA3464723.1 Mth938-like domain-containing protein [Rhodobacter sp.]MCA3468665.1 Mth938-like domain-containing protein [Rhodobacter sp.]
MRLTEITYSEAQPIDGYGPGFFRVGGRVMQGAVLVSPWSSQVWGGLDDTATPLALADRIDVLFVGTGAEIAHLPAGFRRILEEAGIGVEVMNSPAACRTYNVLLSEGRLIAVALLPV